jgi:transcriptional regulator GlxA family with amidase domain
VGVQLQLVEMFDQITHSLRNSPDDALPWTALTAQQLILSLTHQAALDDDLLTVCRSYLIQHLDQTISVDAISSLCNLPASQLRQTFHKRTGMELIEYQQRLRVDRAISMLGDYSISLEEIARKLGYDNTGDLGVQFKRITGQSPLQYRQRLF